jgi:hypothetical protein
VNPASTVSFFFVGSKMLYFISSAHQFSDSFAVPNWDLVPTGISPEALARARAVMSTENNFRACTVKSDCEFEKAVKFLLAIWIRVQCQDCAGWVSVNFEPEQLAAIVSEWDWSEFIPWMSSERFARFLKSASESALAMCGRPNGIYHWTSLDVESARLWTQLAEADSGNFFISIL